jgi:hypothetical protein
MTISWSFEWSKCVRLSIDLRWWEER